MELHKIVDRMWLVPGRNQGRFPFSHAIWVEGERKILFDAGTGQDVMAAFLRSHPVDVAFASHSHPGHLASFWLLDGTPLFAPVQSKTSFGNLEKLAERFVEDESARKLWIALYRKVLGFRDVTHTHTYDGQTGLDLQTLKLAAVHTPGHTTDHHCFFEEHTGTLLAFDLDLSTAGPFYCSRESDLESFRASLHLIRSYEPEVLVSSHMGVLRTGITEAIDRFLAVLDDRDRRILAATQEPVPLEQLVDRHLLIPRFPENLAPIYREWERRMLRAHLERLQDQHEVEQTEDGFRTP